jgi:hypothetical protein
MHGARPMTLREPNNLHADRIMLMKSIKAAVFFDIIYPRVSSYNTLFIAKKYRLHLIYISVGLSYFLGNKVTYVLKAGGGAASGLVFTFSIGWLRYKNRKLLAKDLIEKGPILLKPSPPLRFSQKARSFSLSSFADKERWKNAGAMSKHDPSEGR